MPGQFPFAPAPLMGANQWNPFFAFSGNMPGGPAAAMGAGMLSPYIFGPDRYATGIGGYDNIHNNLRSLRQTEMHEQVLQQAAKYDQNQAAGMFLQWQNMYAKPPDPMNMPTEMANRLQSSTMLAHSPMAGFAITSMARMNPAFVDAAFAGGGGSMTTMADAIFRSTRGMQAADPFGVQTRAGMNAEQTVDYTRRIFDDLYGTPEARKAMGGITARESGEMVGELRRRGMLPRAEIPSSTDLARDIHKNITAEEWEKVDKELETSGKFSRELRDELESNSYNPSNKELEQIIEQSETMRSMVTDSAREIDTEGISNKIKGYSKAVNAISELFEDPNTPMRQLFQGLDALVRGGMPQLDDAALSQTVRTTMNLADTLKIDVGTAVALSTQASQAATSMGLNELFGTQAAQGSMGFLKAYRDAGGASAPAWGLASAEQLMQMDTQLRLGASASELGNQLNAAMRIADVSGPGAVVKGKKAEAYINAIKAGQTEFVDPDTGETRSLGDVEAGEFEAMMAEGVKGMNTAAVAGFVAATDLNAEYGYEANTQQTLRAQQREEVIDEMGRVGIVTQQALMEGSGVAKGKRANLLASQAMEVGGKALFELSPQELADQELRDSIVGSQIVESLSASDPEFAKKFASMSEEERNRFTRQMGAGVYNAGEIAIDSAAPNLGGIQNAGRLFNQDMTDSAGANVASAKYEAIVQDTAAGEGKGSFMERLARAMSTGSKDDAMGLLDIVGESLNVKKKDELKEMIMEPLDRLHAKRQELLDMTVTGEAGEESRKKMLGAIDKEIATLTEQLETFDEQTGGELSDKMKADVESADDSSKPNAVTVENGFEIFGTIKIDDGKTERQGNFVDSGLEPAGPEGAAPTPANTN